REMLARGYERSATFKALVDELETLPGIVYVEETVKLSQHMDGALFHVVAGSREHPVLRVVIRSGLSRDYATAGLADELQHVVEALHALKDDGRIDLAAIFRSLDTDSPTGKYETVQAQRVAARVVDELRVNGRPRSQ